MSIRINGQVIASATDITDYSKKTGNETFSGVKTFSSSPIIPTPAYTDNSTNAANTEWIRTNIAPAGSVMIWAGTTVPTGYLLCDGSAVSRTTYADLFAVIGTTYGPGDSSGTFNLPNFTNRFIEGGTVGTYKDAGLPNISGAISDGLFTVASSVGTGAFKSNLQSTSYGGLIAASAYRGGFDFSASRSSSIYGNSTTVQPSALCMNLIIKY